MVGRFTRNLTFALAVEKVSDGDSGRSHVDGIDREEMPVERLHPKTVYSHCRPDAAGQPNGLDDRYAYRPATDASTL